MSLAPAQIQKLVDLPTDSLIKLLEFGQFGAALAMLILGFYLHWAAVRGKSTQIEARKQVAKQFMIFAISFFLLCSVAEIVKTFLPASPAKVKAMIAVPPLDEKNYKDYGELVFDVLEGDRPSRRPATGVAQPFVLQDGASITISLNNLTRKLDEVTKDKQLLEKVTLTQGNQLGPGDPK
jgi:hypothetical protein